jgi:hypothetical protein
MTIPFCRQSRRTQLACIFLLCSVCFSGFNALGQTETGKNSRLAEIVAQAKSLGLQQVEIPPVHITPTGLDDLATLTYNYSAVIASPVQIVSVPTKNGINTWFKFRKAEVLFVQNAVDQDEKLSSAPDSMLPLKANEFLVVVSGGQVVIDGITVIQKHPRSISFKQGQTYLMFLHFESAEKLASLPALENSVFLVDAAGKLTPLVHNNSALLQEVKNLYDNNLSSLKTALKQMKGVQ